MMLTYVTVPSRLVGIKAHVSRRDKFTAAVVGGAVGAIVCTPPYVVARIGIVLLGSGVTFVIGVVLLAFGFTLQAGATGAVKALKMSAKLVAGSDPATITTPPSAPVPETVTTPRLTESSPAPPRWRPDRRIGLSAYRPTPPDPAATGGAVHPVQHDGDGDAGPGHPVVDQPAGDADRTR